MTFGFAVLYVAKINKEAAFRALENFCRKNNFFFQAKPDRSINYKISGKSNGRAWNIENFVDLHRNHITKKDESLLRFLCNSVLIEDGFGVMDMYYKDAQAQGNAEKHIKENMEVLFHGELERDFDSMEMISHGEKEFADNYVAFIKSLAQIQKIIDPEIRRYLMAYYAKKSASGYFGILLSNKGVVIKAPGSNNEKDVMNLILLSEKILKKVD
jgi:hypothetical protein